MEKAADMGRWMAERTIDAQRASATVRKRERGKGGEEKGEEQRARNAHDTLSLCLSSPPPPHSHKPNTRKKTHEKQVPRDTVQLYKQLAETGLQYGPAFRLLRNVHVPDTTTTAAAAAATTAASAAGGGGAAAQ